MRWAAGVLAAALAAAAQGTCDPPGERAESARYLLGYRTDPPRIAVSEPFLVDFTLCAKGDAPAPQGVRVDAHMPEHRHGMNYRPEVRPLGGGRYRAVGLVFHMPGRWELVFELNSGGATERLARSIVVE
jgi:hypothetical protein